MSIKALLRRTLPSHVVNLLRHIRSKVNRANVVHPTGSLVPGTVSLTFVMAVGSSFDQERPDAMMTCRMGYCHAFEDLGIPYLIADVRDLVSLLDDIPNPFIMFFGADVHLLSDSAIRRLRRYPCAVWLYPWFRHSDRFFALNDLDPATWTLPGTVKQKIIELDPEFGFTATVPSGLGYFDIWEDHGIRVSSLPLACDTRVYSRITPNVREFDGIKLAFVGGYWASKGRQIDCYLRPFENILTIYGYNKWPYTGYRGRLDVDKESSLYRQAILAPAVNEPTVRLLKGQINERVFKVLGSYGCTVVDAVPAYRELYSDEELLVSEGADHFRELVHMLLSDVELNERYRRRGHDATLERHTYAHRAKAILREFNIPSPSRQHITNE